MYRPFAFLFATAFTLPGLAGELTTDSAEEEGITAASRAFSRAYVAGDFDAMADAYAESAHILPEGSPIVTGREAIRERWRLPQGVRILEHRTESVELRVLGDYAYDMGCYVGRTRRADGSEVDWSGNYVIVWRKLDGEWKMQVDSWNSTE